MTLTIAEAIDSDADQLAHLAAVTFPLACPPSTTRHDAAAFIAAHLSAVRFAGYLADSARKVLVARDGGRLVGYAMLITAIGDDPDVLAAVPQRPAVELSKMYVLPNAHGAGVSAALMEAALRLSRDLGAACVWLGVNEENQRAQRFYAKQGFTVCGAKTFRLGSVVENDYVMVRPLTAVTAAAPIRSA